MNLREQNILVFDCEIKNEIDGKLIKWSDHAKMGHAVSASYNFKTANYKIYFDDNLADLQSDMEKADLVTGFNVKDFDFKLLQANLPTLDPSKLRIYDMLEESRMAAGNRFAKGLKLDDHLAAIFGAEGMKSGDGADAPKLFRDGKLGKLCTYVLRDVNREAALFQHIWLTGNVKTANWGLRKVRDPRLWLPTAKFKIWFDHPENGDSGWYSEKIFDSKDEAYAWLDSQQHDLAVSFDVRVMP